MSAENLGHVKSLIELAGPIEHYTEGRKDDAGKPRYDLIDPVFLDGLARVLTIGATKYGERNWEKGMRWGRCFSAHMRHMWAWWMGEPTDHETGLSHLDHAACCLMFLVSYNKTGAGRDDRPAPKQEHQS